MAEFRLNCDYVTKKGLGKACKASGRFEVSDVDFLKPKMACMLHIRQMCKLYRIPVCFEVFHDGNMVPVDTNGIRLHMVPERVPQIEEQLEEHEEEHEAVQLEEELEPPPPPPPIFGDNGEPLCMVCYSTASDEEEKSEGVFCQGMKHGMCNTCFSQYVKTESSKFDFDGKIKCLTYHQGCNSAYFTVSAIAKVVPEEIFQEFYVATLKKHEKDLILELNEEHEKRLKAKENDGELSFVQKERLHIIENILTLKCPNNRCKKAFLDYDGCVALKCSVCPQFFCGKCLKKTNNKDTNHAHVAQCLPSGSYYATENEFNKFQALRRMQIINKYLEKFTEEQKITIKEACNKDFVDLGIIV
jgi:hypothetical protein